MNATKAIRVATRLEIALVEVSPQGNPGPQGIMGAAGPRGPSGINNRGTWIGWAAQSTSRTMWSLTPSSFWLVLIQNQCG